MSSLGLQIKAGLHAGECERLENSIAESLFILAPELLRLQVRGEILVSSTVKELVMGSGSDSSTTVRTA